MEPIEGSKTSAYIYQTPGNYPKENLLYVSLKQSRFYHCQTSTAHRQRIKVDGSVATISIKNFPVGLHVMNLYFPDTPRKLKGKAEKDFKGTG
jgi:hypothetical protein